MPLISLLFVLRPTPDAAPSRGEPQQEKFVDSIYWKRTTPGTTWRGGLGYSLAGTVRNTCVKGAPNNSSATTAQYTPRHVVRRPEISPNKSHGELRWSLRGLPAAPR